jgi:hypothetical protein
VDEPPGVGTAGSPAEPPPPPLHAVSASIAATPAAVPTATRAVHPVRRDRPVLCPCSI